MRKFLTTIIAIVVLSSFTGDYIQSKASWYGGIHHGRKTASGEVFDENKLTAAHKTLSFGSSVEVINIDNEKSCTVIINDRGPFIKGRDLDLSKKAFSKISNLKKGVINVKYKVL